MKLCSCYIVDLLVCDVNYECTLFVNYVQGHGPISGMACDASGGLLATGGNNGTVMVWDVDGGFSTHYFKGHKTVVSTVMFHSDPTKLLVSTGSDSVYTLINGWQFLF